MKEYDADLHLHGTESGGVSKNMLLPAVAEQSKLKGLSLLCTGDVLNSKWLSHIRENLREESNGIFVEKKSLVPFIIGVEVECAMRVHHLVYLPDISAAEQLKESMRGKANFEGWGTGRPRLRLNPEQVAEKVNDAGGIIGPAHAFTPYFSVYGHFDSIRACYGKMAEKIGFMELGLSADTSLADLIPDNRNYQFCTFSDAHSPFPHRIGREFTRIRMKEPSFRELEKVLLSKEPNITLNVGLDPREGKYHLSGCNSCYRKYSLEEAVRFRWRCPKCGSAIKKGVRDRIFELAPSRDEKHPAFRPRYLHCLPLAEIIQIAQGIENVNSKSVQFLWREFVDRFGSEIAVLIDVPAGELAEIDAEVAKKIDSFRKGLVLYIPGGGGQYGKPVICSSEKEFAEKSKELERELNGRSELAGQKTLGEFS